MGKVLEFKWGVSRGRDTYGYAICSLYVDGKKVSSCNGGGYDMKGTSLGLWMQYEFRKELLKIDIPITRRNGQEERELHGLTFHDPKFRPGEQPSDQGEMTIDEAEKAGLSFGLERYQAFYRSSSKTPTERHVVPLIDGACGMSSVEHILSALGYKLRYVSQSANRSTYLMEPMNAESE